MDDEEIGLVTCSMCDGKGYVSTIKGSKCIKTKICGFDFFRTECSNCNGKGKLSWIKNVFPDKEESVRVWTESTGEEVKMTFESFHSTYWWRSGKEKPVKNWKHWSDKR